MSKGLVGVKASDDVLTTGGMDSVKIATTIGLTATFCLTASSCGGAAKQTAEPATPAATVTVTTTAPPVEPAKTPCTIPDPDLFLTTRSWDRVVASAGSRDGAHYADEFYDYISELQDDHDEEECGGQKDLALLAYRAAVMQAGAMTEDTSQVELSRTARVGNRWLASLDYTAGKFRA